MTFIELLSLIDWMSTFDTASLQFLIVFSIFQKVFLYVDACRATIKSQVKLEKTLTFVLIATKTSWLLPQHKTEKKLNKLSRTM